MSKRKFDVAALEAANPSGATSVKRQRKNLLKVLENGKTQLFRAIRLARGFERQKLGRRQKNSKSKESKIDTARLQAEYEATKALDLSNIADLHMCRHMMRTKAIAEHPAVPEDVRIKAAQPVPKEAAFSNVTARLYNARPVADAMRQVMGIIGRTLDLREEDMKPSKRMRRADFEAAVADHKTESVAAKASHQQKAQPDQELGNDVDEGDSFAGFSDLEAGRGGHDDADFNSEDEDVAHDMPKDQPLAAGTSDEDEEDLSRFDSRLASDSATEDDEDEENNLNDRLAHGLYKARLDSANRSAAGSGSSRSPSISGSLSMSPEPIAREGAKHGKKLNSSAFLPTLASGYISGSESDASDVSALAAPRKNRKGQRARQAEWERKFGANAKHLKRGKGSQNRDTGWDARRGATDGQRLKPWRQRKAGPPQERQGLDRATRQQKRSEEPPEKVPTYGAAHPSWIAKQQAQAKAAAAAKPAGKKITFD